MVDELTPPQGPESEPGFGAGMPYGTPMQEPGGSAFTSSPEPVTPEEMAGGETGPPPPVWGEEVVEEQPPGAFESPDESLAEPPAEPPALDEGIAYEEIAPADAGTAPAFGVDDTGEMDAFGAAAGAGEDAFPVAEEPAPGVEEPAAEAEPQAAAEIPEAAGGEGPPPEKPTKKGGGGKGFFSSPRNRIIAVVVAVFALLAMLAVVAGLVVIVFIGRARTPTPTPVAPSATTTPAQPGAPGTGAKPTAPATAAPEPVSDEIPPSFEVFAENRDPFKPGVVPRQAGVGGVAGTTSTTSTGGAETGAETTGAAGEIRPGANVLYLHDIENRDGELVAIVYWDNTRYEVVEGDSIAESPWQVISITSSSATFLYGDDRITLRVGEQLGK